MQNDKTFLKRLGPASTGLLRKSARTCYDLFKIMVPISILTKVLAEMGVVDWVGELIAPVMKLVGLPGSMGLAWATAMLTNIYGGLAVFTNVAPGENLTVAQATVFATMVLVAHSLPVELRIAQKAGPRFRVMVLLRVGGALVIGWALNMLYTKGGFLQQPARWQAAEQDASWAGWAQGQAWSLLKIAAIILSLLLLMKILKHLGIIALLTRLLKPVLRALGMSEAAAPITIIGMTLGISYGGGLIIQEARSGRLTERDVFFSLALMGIAHSLIEDTAALALYTGAHLSGILWIRLLFSLLIVSLLVRIFRNVPDETFHRYFFRKHKAEEEEASPPSDTSESP